MYLEGQSVVLRPFRRDEFDRVWSARTSESAYPPGLLASRERTMRRLRNSGRLVGEIDARRPQGSMPPGVLELGISLFEESDRGRGYGREAVGLSRLARPLAARTAEHEFRGDFRRLKKILESSRPA